MTVCSTLLYSSTLFLNFTSTFVYSQDSTINQLPSQSFLIYVFFSTSKILFSCAFFVHAARAVSAFPLFGQSQGWVNFLIAPRPQSLLHSHQCKFVFSKTCISAWCDYADIYVRSSAFEYALGLKLGTAIITHEARKIVPILTAQSMHMHMPFFPFLSLVEPVTRQH